MIEKEIEVKIANGLHARPVAQFVKIVNQFKSDVLLVKNERRIDAKSIFNLMSAAIREGDRLKIIVDGADENEAMQAIETFLQTGEA